MPQAQSGWRLVQPATSAPGWTRVQSATVPAAQEPDWIDKLTAWLPTVGGTVGGIAGTAGGPLGSVGGAALGGMAGEAYKELINRARGRRAPATVGDAATAMASEGAWQGGAQVAGAAVAPVARAVGARVMQSAVKPGLRLLKKASGDTPRVVQTLLDEGINVTPGGVEQLKGLIGGVNQRIGSAIQQTPGQVTPLRVTSRLTDTARRYGQQVNPQPDLESISRVGENFLEAHGGRALALPEAQALKVGTYARLGEKYGTEAAAGIEAEKALARGLKEEIASQVPGVSALNAREGRLLEALDAVGRRVAVAGNRDPIGFAWVAHNPTTFLAALIDRSPTVKSLIARGLYNHAGQIAQVPPALIRVAVHALASDDPQAGFAVMSTDQERPR